MAFLSIHNFSVTPVLLYADSEIGVMTMKNIMSFNCVISQLIKLSAVAWIKLCQLIFIQSCWANEFCGSFLQKISFDHVSSLWAKIKCRYLLSV